MSKIDVILVAPTGGGKSLTYQLPAVCDVGITVVVCPLISLMEDQLYSLRKRNIPAELLCQASEQETVARVYKILNDPGYSSQLKLLYVTPERLAKSKRLMNALQKCYQNRKLERIAIDEVHCCSVMGHDFRTDYKYLGTLKKLFPNVPLLCVTATASRKVITDVQKILNIRDCMIFNTPFNRPNLYYHVIEKPNEAEAVYDMLADLLKNRYAEQTGIIYTFSVKDTETLVSELLQRDCKVRPYHASLEANQRSAVYQKWMAGEIQAVCATIAFGLGIDKPNVRFVIHHTMSKSMENYYQESGRAGRDGNYAECLVLFKFSDMFKLSAMTFVEQNGLRNVYSMVNYCINAKICRRDLFSKYFTEVWNDRSCGKMCDHCYFKNQRRAVDSPKMDILTYYRTLLKIIERASSMDIRLTALKLCEAWFNKGPAKLRSDVPPPSIDRFYGEQIVTFLITEDYLREDFHYTAYSTVSYIQRGLRIPEDDQLEFQPSRVLDLPPVRELTDFLEATTTSDDDVSFVKEEKLTPQKIGSESRKRRMSSSSDESEDDPRISLRETDLEKFIEEKVESKLMKMLNESNTQSPIRDDDVVFITPKKEDVETIEID